MKPDLKLLALNNIVLAMQQLESAFHLAGAAEGSPTKADDAVEHAVIRECRRAMAAVLQYGGARQMLGLDELPLPVHLDAAQKKES